MFDWILSPFFGKQNEEKPDASIFKKALELAEKALVVGNDQDRANAFSTLIKFSHSSPDLSFIGFSLTPLIASPNIRTRIIGFRAMSIFLSSTSPAVEMLPSVLRKSFQYDELLIPALRALTFIINPFVFHCLKKDIIEIATESNDVPRLLALHCVYLSYKQKPKYIKHLLPLLKRAIVHPALRYTASSILCEISYKDCSQLKQFISILLTEIPLATPHMFTKFSRFLQNFINFDPSTASLIEKPIFQYLNRNDDIISTCEAPFIITKLQNNAQMIQLIGKRLQTIILNETDYNYRAQVLWSLSLIYPEFTIDTVLLSEVANSEDNYTRSCAQRLRTVMTTDKVAAINEILKIIEKTCDASLFEFALNYVQPIGQTYVRVLLALGQLNSYYIQKKVANLILSISDQETQQLLLDELTETIAETPEDLVGNAMAQAIANWSGRDSDISILIPPSIGSRAVEDQIHLVNCAMQLWTRLQFKISKIVLFRLQFLTQSFDHEVRQLAGQLIDLDAIIE